MEKSIRAAAAHRLGLASLVLLAALCFLWEWQWAPILTGGSWLILKSLPLLMPIWIVWRHADRRRYTYQWSTLLIWFYFTEGIVRAWSDQSATSRWLAGFELLLCLIIFAAAVTYIRNTPLPNRANDQRT